MSKRTKKPKAEQKIDWRRMLECDPLVQELVKSHHAHLERAKIVVLGKPKARKRHGKTIVASAYRATETIATLVKEISGEDLHYYILVGLDAWDALDMKVRKIWIDRALLHFTGLDVEKSKWGIQGPDVEAFTAELRRHGAWNVELQMFCREAKQLKLDLPV